MWQTREWPNPIRRVVVALPPIPVPFTGDLYVVFLDGFSKPCVIRSPDYHCFPDPLLGISLFSIASAYHNDLIRM